MTPTLILLYVFAYVLGSIPFGLLVGMTQGVDIRKIGSGNIGTTNVYRALGKTCAAIVFILDVGKGYVPPVFSAIVLRQNGQDHDVSAHAVFVGAAAVIGHSFSPFLKFKGGKGVATGLGVLLGVAPLVGLAGFSTFVLVVGLTRYVSIASICACFVVIIGTWVTRQPPVVVAVFGFVTAFVVVRHIPNIKRLIKGEEPKIQFGKPEGPEGK